MTITIAILSFILGITWGMMFGIIITDEKR